MEALGYSLLHLFHGSLPWQGIYAPSENAKMVRIGEMKLGPAMEEYLQGSPPEFAAYFHHVRGLQFEEEPDYEFLVSLFRQRMEQEGWEMDGRYDWIQGAPRGTLIPDEYQFKTEYAYDLTVYDNKWI